MEQIYKQIFGCNIPKFSFYRFITLIKKRFYPDFIKVRNEHIGRSIHFIIFVTCILSLSYLIYNNDNILYSHYKLEPTEKITKTDARYKCCESDYYYSKYNVVGRFTQIDGWTTHDVLDIEVEGELCKHKFNPETNILTLKCSDGAIAGYILLIMGLGITSFIYIILLILYSTDIKECNLSYSSHDEYNHYSMLWFFVSTNKTGISTIKYIGLYVKLFLNYKINLQEIIKIITNKEYKYFNEERSCYRNIDDESYKYMIHHVIHNNREDDYNQFDIDGIENEDIPYKNVMCQIANNIQYNIELSYSSWSSWKQMLSFKETVEFIVNYYPFVNKDICEK